MPHVIGTVGDPEEIDRRVTEVLVRNWYPRAHRSWD